MSAKTSYLVIKPSSSSFWEGSLQGQQLKEVPTGNVYISIWCRKVFCGFVGFFVMVILMILLHETSWVVFTLNRSGNKKIKIQYAEWSRNSKLFQEECYLPLTDSPNELLVSTTVGGPGLPHFFSPSLPFELPHPAAVGSASPGVQHKGGGGSA